MAPMRAAEDLGRDLRLFEVDESLLSALLSGRAELKGDDSGCVLCTDQSTHSLKQLETSNTLLLSHPTRLCPQGDDGSVTTEVVATARRTFELSRVGSAAGGHARAFLDTRREQQHLSGADMPMHAEHCRSEEWVSMDELLEHVPASSAEILSELRESGAVQLDNNMWWMPPPGHFSEMVDIALPAIRAQGDDLSSADATALEETLEREDGYRRDVVRAFMRQHSMKNDDGTLAIDLRSVARLKARHLLPADSKPIKLEDFMERWRNACPENSADHVCTELLECLAIVEQDKHGQSVVVPLAEESLPLQPKALFAKLFEARKRWEWKSLEPYIRRCAPPGQSLEKLLLKHTRKLPQSDGREVYIIRS